MPVRGSNPSTSLHQLTSWWIWTRWATGLGVANLYEDAHPIGVEAERDRVSGEAPWKLVRERFLEHLGVRDVSSPDEQLEARTPVVITGHLVIEAKDLGPAPDPSCAVTQARADTVHDRTNRFDVERLREIDTRRLATHGPYRHRSVRRRRHLEADRDRRCPLPPVGRHACWPGPHRKCATVGWVRSANDEALPEIRSHGRGA
jgi:hypothetical protein